MICSTYLSIPSILYLYIPFTLSTLSIITSLLILFTFFRFPRLRLNSGKMVLYIVVCELNMHWLILLALLYKTQVQSSCQSSFIIKEDACSVLGLFFMFFQLGYISMNGFLVHNLYCVLNYRNENFKARFLRYFWVSLVFSIGVLIYASTDLPKEINIGYMGICGLAKGSSVQLVSLVFLLIILPFCGYVFVVSIKHYKALRKENSLSLQKDPIIYNNALIANSPFLSMEKPLFENEGITLPHERASIFENEQQRVYLFLNMSYIALFILDWLPLALLNFNSWLGFVFSGGGQSDFSEAFETLSLILISGNGLWLFCIRIREPSLKRFFKKMIKKDIFNRKKPFKKSLKAQLLDKALINSTSLDKAVESPPKVPLEQSSLSSEGWVLNYRRVFLLLGVLLKRQQGESVPLVLCSSPFGKENKEEKAPEQEEKIPWAKHWYNKCDVHVYSLSKELLELNQEERSLLEGEAIQITALTYCKRLFDWIRARKLKNITIKSLISSLSLVENGKLISLTEQTPYPEFLTYDKQVLVCLIPKERKKFLLEQFLRPYHGYIEAHYKTFLPKFLGLFSFQIHNIDNGKEKGFSVLLIENPLMELQVHRVKELFKRTQEKALAVMEFRADKVKQKMVSGFEIEKGDLKLKSRDKERLLKALYRDLEFLTDIGAFNYRFLLVFCKFEDKVLINEEENIKKEGYNITKDHKKKKNMKNNLENKLKIDNAMTFRTINRGSSSNNISLKEEIIAKSKKKSKNFKDIKLLLENKVGFCIGSFRNIFDFIEKHGKNVKEKSFIMNKEVCIENPVNYGRFLFDQAQNL